MLEIQYSSDVFLVLEADGTNVENNEVLAEVANETLMIVTPGNKWCTYITMLNIKSLFQVFLDQYTLSASVLSFNGEPELHKDVSK
jgi:hypothetical protein